MIQIFEDISVLFPYKADNGPRDTLFGWVKMFYAHTMPEAQLCIGEDYGPVFSRTQAINNAAKKADRHIFVIADADIVYDPAILCASTKLLTNHAWVIPFHRVRNLTKASTEALLQASPKWPLPIDVHSSIRKYAGMGGLNVITRQYFEQVGGFDERFVGWGAEDQAFALSVNTLCGPMARLDTDIFHLWHPPAGKSSNPYYRNNYALYRRYIEARGNRQKMKRLIQERNEDVRHG